MATDPPSSALELLANVAEQLTATARGELVETGAAPVLDANLHRPLVLLKAGGLALMIKKSDTFISVVMITRVDDDTGTLTVDYLAHQVNGVEYDFSMELCRRGPILPVWLLTDKRPAEAGSWYVAPKKDLLKGRGKHVRSTETLTQSRVNILAAGFELAAGKTLPPEVCTAASRLIASWDHTWGTPPGVSTVLASCPEKAHTQARVS